MNAMDSPYVRGAPSPQQTVDVFAGKWASRLPGKFADLRAGTNLLFDDPKIRWAKEKLGELGVSLSGSTVLELGPLEGGHVHAGPGGGRVSDGRGSAPGGLPEMPGH